MSEANAPARVAVRGDDDVATAVADAGPEIVDDEPDAVVAVGEAAFLDAALSGDGAPVLPVTPGGGHHAVPRRRVGEAAASLAGGAGRRVAHRLLDVAVDGDHVARAVLDVTLMTSEPARISEYAVLVDGERVDEVRSDGIVVATPAGTDGYANAAGGPVLAPGAGLSVVPVAPFETDSESWVVPDAVTLSVERDEGDVTLFADADAVEVVPAHAPVRVAPAGEFSLLRLPETGPAE